jgi:Cdc6-like AAA superfamily ATPase
MKFHETHFEEYIAEANKCNLHPKLNKIFEKFPKSLNKLKNIIIYGPSGTGKYTQMLKSIKKYSPSDLKYEKKIVTQNKQFFLKISDIHYEVDMSLLGCNSKLLWHEIYQQIIDIISTKTDKTGIIVCKYFHEIHCELLEYFYSYMQQNESFNIDIKFILITEQLSFIPECILNCCEIIPVSRPSKYAYTKIIKTKLPCDLKIENITNIKILNNYNENIMSPQKIIINKIVTNIFNVNEIKFISFRDILYDTLIYNLDIADCAWHVICKLIEENKVNKQKLSQILIVTFCFFKYYNNNYRPIYHLEKFFLNLAKIIHNIS